MLHPVAVQEFIERFLARVKSRASEDTTAQQLASLTSQIEKLKWDAERLMDLYLAESGPTPEVVRTRLKK